MRSSNNTDHCCLSLCTTQKGNKENMASERRAIRRFWVEEKFGDARISPLWPPGPEEDRQESARNRESTNSGLRSEVVDMKIPDDDDVPHQQQGSSELNRLSYSVEEASFSCPDGAAAGLMEAGVASSWKGGAAGGWVLLKLRETSLLSFLRVRNRSTSEISISISLKGKRRRDFVKVKRGIQLAHEHLKDVKIGHLPCQYIRVECHSAGARGTSLYELAPVGIPAKFVRQYMGPSMEDLTYKSTERLLFGPSLRTSLAPVCPAAALERLALPPSYLRSPADTDVRRPSNGARRPPAAATEGFPFHEPHDDCHDVGIHRHNYHSDGIAFPEDAGDRGILGPVANENTYSGFTSARNGGRGQGLGMRQAKSMGRDAGWREGEDLDSGSVAAGRRGRRQERDSSSEVVGSGGKGVSSRHRRDARGVYDGPPHPNFLFSSRAKDILSRSGSGGRR